MTTALPGPAAPRSPAVARLVQFTEQLHSSVGRLESLAMVNGHPDLVDSDRVALVGLGEDLLELRQRTERPEVRVLVLGPLKAGKSTFMNALVRRADASQVSVLPAFPCYVEVRDVERDSSGHPTQPERSVLYNRGGKPVEQLTLADCQLRLDELLRAYLRADSPAVKARLQDSCTRVTQFIDLGGSPEGLDVTLVDSPGLFFDTTVDDEILRSTQATTPTATDNSVEYSSVSRSLYGLADVAVFVIRPEQLFFEVVARWLARFVERPKMHVFLVVNASSQARNLTGGGVVGVDQIAARQELCDYFLHHVAGARLTGELVLGHKISLDVADLLSVASEELAGEPASGDSAAHSRAVVERVRAYLGADDLVGAKVANLAERFKSQVTLAGAVVGRLQAATAVHLDEARAELSAAEATIATIDGDIRGINDELANILRQESRLADQLSQLARWEEDGPSAERPLDHEDPELSSYLNLFAPAQHAGDPLGLDRATDHRLRELLTKVVRDWASGEFGERNLRNLAKMSWTHQPAAASPPLVDQFNTALRDRCRRVLGAAVSRAGAAESPAASGFSRAVAATSADRLELYLANPLPPDRELPALRPGFRRFGFVGINWDRFWGTDRDKVVAGRWVSRLKDEVDELVAGMLHEPWELADNLAPYRLEYEARLACGAAVGRAWQGGLRQELAALASRRAMLTQRLAESQTQLTTSQAARVQQAGEVAGLDADAAELASRAAELAILSVG